MEQRTAPEKLWRFIKRYNRYIKVGLITLIALIIAMLPNELFGIEGLTVVHQRIIALFVFAALMWILEVIPIWTTSVLVITLALLGTSNTSLNFLKVDKFDGKAVAAIVADAYGPGADAAAVKAAQEAVVTDLAKVSNMTPTAVRNTINGYALRLDTRKQKAEQARSAHVKLQMEANELTSRFRMLTEMEQHQEGLYWLEQAVQRKDVHSAYLLGSLYLGTTSLPRDLRCAIRMLEWAARNDHAKANRVLGQIFLARHPKALDYTPIDPRRALKHLLLARELGSTGDEDLIREAEALLRL